MAQDDPKRRAALEEARRLAAEGKITTDQQLDEFMRSRGVAPAPAPVRQDAPQPPSGGGRTGGAGGRGGAMPARATVPDVVKTSDPVIGALRAVGEGATLGFAGELEAAVRAPFSKKSFGEIREGIGESQDVFREERPGLAFAADAAGMFIPVAGAATKAYKGAKAVGGGVRQAVSAAKTGAKVGAVAGVGYGDAESLGEAAGDAARGAGLGAVLGGAGSAVASASRGAGSVAQDIASARRNKTGFLDERAKNAGRKEQIKRLVDGGMSVPQARAEIQRLQAEGLPASLMDVSPAMSQLGKEVHEMGGEGSRAVGAFSAERRRTSSGRVAKSIKETSGVPEQSVDDYIQANYDKAAPHATALYEQALPMEVTLDAAASKTILRPSNRKRWYEAKRLDAEERAADGSASALKPLFKEKEGGKVELVRAVTVRDIDLLKKSLDDEIMGLPRGSNKRRVLAKQRTALLKDTPSEYKEARDFFAGQAGVRRYAEKGKKFHTADVDEFNTLMAKAKPEEKEAYRLAAVARQYSRLRSPRGQKAALDVFESDEIKRRLRALYPDQASFDDLIRRLEAERRTFQLPKPDPTNPSAGLKGPGASSTSGSALTFGARAAAARALAAVGRRLEGQQSVRTGAFLGRDLTATGRGAQANLDILEAFLKKDRKLRSLSGQGAGVVGGSLGGRGSDR